MIDWVQKKKKAAEDRVVYVDDLSDNEDECDEVEERVEEEYEIEAEMVEEREKEEETLERECYA